MVMLLSGRQRDGVSEKVFLSRPCHEYPSILCAGVELGVETQPPSALDYAASATSEESGTSEVESLSEKERPRMG